MPNRRSLLLCLLILALATGCAGRPVKEQVYEEGGTRALLRSYKTITSTVPQGYEHPVTISPVRMAHILSRIDLRRDDAPDRVPAIPLSLLYRMADGLSKGLEEAGPDQEVVVLAKEKKKSLFVFDHFFLTSLMAYHKDELLYIHIAYSDYPLDKQRTRGKYASEPEAYKGVYPRKFRLLVDQGMTLNDHQSVAVEWRDDVFRKPTRTRITSTGKVVRKQVLMESFEELESLEPKAPEVAEELTPAQLRGLADLEEARQNGQISETKYKLQKRKILRGEAPEPL